MRVVACNGFRKLGICIAESFDYAPKIKSTKSLLAEVIVSESNQLSSFLLLYQYCTLNLDIDLH